MLTTVVVTDLKPYQIRDYVWCLNIPPRCSKFRIEFKTVTKIETHTKLKPKEECCEGYFRNNNESRCLPVCNSKCLNGKCIAPETCECREGFGGPSCDISKIYLEESVFSSKIYVILGCKSGYWGVTCSNKCSCQNGGKCDLYDGTCFCKKGWTGKFCNEKCRYNTFGQNCTEKCKCINGDCDPVSGECYCSSGWTGPM